MNTAFLQRVIIWCTLSHLLYYYLHQNEGLVLGSEYGEDAKVIPTPKIIASDIKTAALGKSHTLFLKTDGTLHALGQNKVGTIL